MCIYVFVAPTELLYNLIVMQFTAEDFEIGNVLHLYHENIVLHNL